jgi:phosphatidylserine decarboxylase
VNAYPDDFPPVARDGLVYICLGAALSAGAFALCWTAVGLLLGSGTAFVVWFFRDPRRTTPTGDDLAVSPADGAVLHVEPVTGDSDTGPGSVISIFMNVFNVHVNRSPVAGKVIAVRPRAGRFLSAWNREAVDVNERTEVVVAGPRGPVKFVQVAGLVARRIVCRLQPGDGVLTGQRVGLIKFGSRVDVFLPAAYLPSVAAGDRVTAGVTVIARAGSGGVAP